MADTGRHPNSPRVVRNDTPARAPPPLARGVCHLRKINKSVWYRLMNVDHSSFVVKNGQTYLWPQVTGICGETERNVPCASRGRRRRRNNHVSVVVHIPVSVPVPVAVVVVVGGGKGAIGRRECPLMLSSGGKENGPLIDYVCLPFNRPTYLCTK